MGFNAIQSTRPQTFSYDLHDSPVGQLAWISEKFKEWTDSAAELLEDAVGRDGLLTNISVYWFSGMAGSSANLYYEAGHDASAWAPKARGTVPTGVAVAVSTDIAIRRFAERDHNITYWSELERGGNFLALEQPEEFVTDVRAFFGTLGSGHGCHREARAAPGADAPGERCPGWTATGRPDRLQPRTPLRLHRTAITRTRSPETVGASDQII
ncbi:hypothetical protein ACFW1M_43310 [Streptomyces inhibens]|uniref:hypothetical protein n=1 Tax=Streptomyces inhibens TaxID=2293571 RepID=UPI00369D72DE